MTHIPTVWHPYTQHGQNQPIMEVERAQGVWLYTTDGRRILDAISSWWVNLHGHGHQRIVKAITQQAQQLEQVIFAGFTHAPAEDLAQQLLALAPKNLETVFYSDNGSTAVEVALKMAVGHFHNQGRPRHLFVAFEHAYHGDTVGAMSVGAPGPFTAFYQRLLFPVQRIPFPEAGQEEETLRVFRQMLTQQGDDIAGLIIEPLILGAGGMRTYAPELIRELRALCDHYGVLLIADEVMTGFGRTGTLFAMEQTGVAPDLMCLSKGITGGFLPLGATLATGEVFKSFLATDRAKAFYHGHSYTANPLACAAALANLEVFRTEPVWERISTISDTHYQELLALADEPAVVAVRQAGTIAAVEFRAEDEGYLSHRAPSLANFFLSRNILLRPLGNVVYILPPYCITPQELHEVYEAIHESIDFQP